MGNEKQHVRFSGAIGASVRELPCILFQSAQSYCDQLLSGTLLDLVGYPDINEWNGESKIQFVLKGITY